MKDYSTQNIYEVASELNIANEFICNIRIAGGYMLFETKAGAKYSAKLLKNGKVKRNSVRIDG